MYKKDKVDLNKLFKRISAGSADKIERELYAKWLANLDIGHSTPSNQYIEVKRLELQARFQLHRSGLVPRKFKLAKWFPAAAAAILLFLASLWHLIPGTPAKIHIRYTASSTRAGERKIITLSDGSKITLNNSSRLKFPEVFPSDFREVFLEGEGFFEITHNAKKPFIVRTGKLKVQVLGTSFDVRHYESNPDMEVTVATGKVGINARGNNASWMLLPGKQLKYNILTGKAVQVNVNTSDYTGWQKGQLIFKDERLESVCKRLERWYGVTITIKTRALKNKRINMKQDNESLQKVLKMLGMVAGFNYKITDKQVQICQ